MAHGDGVGRHPADRGWRAGRVGAATLGLLLVEGLLVGEVGPPMVLARMLLGLGDPAADPSMSLLALMTWLPRRWWATSYSSWRWDCSPRCLG